MKYVKLGLFEELVCISSEGNGGALNRTGSLSPQEQFRQLRGRKKGGGGENIPGSQRHGGRGLDECVSILKNFKNCVEKLRGKFPWEEEGGVWMCDSFDDFEGFLRDVVKEAQGAKTFGEEVGNNVRTGGYLFAECDGEWDDREARGKYFFINPAIKEKLGSVKTLEVLYYFGQVLGERNLLIVSQIWTTRKYPLKRCWGSSQVSPLGQVQG